MAYISFQPSDYFNTKLYTGNGSTNAITGVGFQPDWLWLKDRSAGGGHILVDAVRGNNKSLSSQDTNGEVTRTDIVTSLDSDGFTLGADSGNFVNVSGNNGVGWNWLANGQGSSNTDGSITSTVSANTTAGFSIVSYTGTASNATVGHGLGVKPAMMIAKNLDNGSEDWCVYHKSLGYNNVVKLNNNSASLSTTTRWNAEPDTSVFNVGTVAETNGSSANQIAYIFAEKKGFSKFGSYTGNGSTDGTFVYTGMSPAFIMVKRTNAIEGWYMYDVKRDTFNVSDAYLFANASSAEATLTNGLDILSNGFKMRNTDTGHNASGSTYTYMALAEEPLVSSNGVPAVAR